MKSSSEKFLSLQKSYTFTSDVLFFKQADHFVVEAVIVDTL
jgi:hypothetical protein